MARPFTKPAPWIVDFILLSAVWGSSFMFMRLAVFDFGTLPTATLRAGIGALALLPLLAWRRQAASALLHWKPLFVVGLLNGAIPNVCMSFALLSISSGLASIVNATVPLFGAILAFVWLGQKPLRLAVAGLCLGFGGVAMLVWNTAGFKPGAEAWAATLGMLSASMGSLSGAASALYTQRYLHDVSPVALSTGSQLGATLVLAIPALLYWPAKAPGTQAWMAVAAAGVLCTGVGYVLFFRVIERAGPSRAMTVTFMMPLFAMAYGATFLGEQITISMLGCAALVIGGTALSMGFGTRWLARRRQRIADSV